jgi:threonine/homoserine/homoserine lactone efflux protein
MQASSNQKHNKSSPTKQMPHLQEVVTTYNFGSILKSSTLSSLLNPHTISTLLSFTTHFLPTIYISQALNHIPQIVFFSTLL